jgi:Starch-binding associating with outer membrane
MKRIYIVYLLLTAFFIGCTDKFEDFNTDKKNPAVASGNSLFTNGQKELADQVNQTNVNQNIYKLVAQYWTETTYIDESNYDLVTRNIPKQIYRYMIRESLRDLNEATTLITEETGVTEEATKQNRLMIIQLLKAYTFGQLVDIFGMVPYTEALNIENVYPKYDDGASIYSDLITKIDAALAGLNPNEDSFGSADLFYGGDVSAWIKFGNALKVKLGITLADVNPTLAKSAVESGAAGAFESSADDCLIGYLSASPNQNPLYEEIVATGRKDYVVANTIVDKMNSLDDPRRAFYFTKFNDAYVGGEYGYSNSYGNYSHINDAILAPTFHGIMMTYTELMFYLAEAAERGFSVPNTAEEYYNMGITSSIIEWGGTQADADAYLAQTNVAYATAPDASTDGWREKIGTQSWIANYTKGLEAWTTWRRLDYPIFNVPELSETVMDIPTRFTFPIEEQTLNPANYSAAAVAVGGDELTTKIFWDMYDANE